MPHPDDFWFGYLQNERDWPKGREAMALSSLEELLATFEPHLRGVVVYGRSGPRHVESGEHHCGSRGPGLPPLRPLPGFRIHTSPGHAPQVRGRRAAAYKRRRHASVHRHGNHSRHRHHVNGQRQMRRLPLGKPALSVERTLQRRLHGLLHRRLLAPTSGHQRIHQRDAHQPRFLHLAAGFLLRPPRVGRRDPRGRSQPSPRGRTQPR